MPANEWITEKLTIFEEEHLLDLPELDFFFLIKHKNAGKIESHLWFFKGFCTYLNPKLVQLIDVGTLPCPDSISKMALYMDMEKQVGGVCGEIEVLVPPKISFFENAIVAA